MKFPHIPIAPLRAQMPIKIPVKTLKVAERIITAYERAGKSVAFNLATMTIHIS